MTLLEDILVLTGSGLISSESRTMALFFEPHKNSQPFPTQGPPENMDSRALLHKVWNEKDDEKDEWRSGRCHCGGLEFRVKMHQQPAVLRCNCTLCARRGVPMMQVRHDQFELVGTESLGEYSFGTHMAVHYFCKRCGVYTHHQPRSSVDHWNVNICCVDGVDPMLLGEVPWLDARKEHPNESEGHSFYGHRQWVLPPTVLASTVADKPLRFFQVAPWDELRALFLDKSQQILNKTELGITRVWQVGSSSIKGMPGLLGVDMLAHAPQWPLGDAFIEGMSALGYRCAGYSPHTEGEGGQWFLMRDDPSIVVNGVTHENIGCVCHVVRPGTMFDRLLALREYCTRVPEGKRRYSELKEAISKVPGITTRSYKTLKHENIGPIVNAALRWWKANQMTADKCDP